MAIIRKEQTDVQQGQFTASWAENAISSSYAVSASHEIIKEVSSSHADYADLAGSASYAGAGTGSYWSGSADGYISRQSNVQITGSLGVNETGSFNYLQVAGDTIVTDDLIVESTGTIQYITGSYIKLSEIYNTVYPTIETNGGIYIHGGSGDVNNSGLLTAADRTAFINYFNGSATLSRAEYARADVDGDGRVTWDDYTITDQMIGESWTSEEAQVSKSDYIRRVHNSYGGVELSNRYGLYVNDYLTIGERTFANPSNSLMVSTGEGEGGLVVGSAGGFPPYVFTKAPESGALFEGTVGIGMTSPVVSDKSLHVLNNISASNIFYKSNTGTNDLIYHSSSGQLTEISEPTASESWLVYSASTYYWSEVIDGGAF